MHFSGKKSKLTPLNGKTNTQSENLSLDKRNLQLPFPARAVGSHIGISQWNLTAESHRPRLSVNGETELVSLFVFAERFAEKGEK